MAQNDFTNLIIWSSLWSLAQIFVRFSRGHFLGIEDELQQFFFILYTFEKSPEQSSYWASDKNTGVQNDPRGTGIKMSSKKILFDAVLIENFDVQNRLFSVFSKKSKSGHFVLQISPWKQHPQKKWSTPRESQWKMQQNCRLRFLIFETLSQRFFTTKFLIIKKNRFSDFMIKIFGFGGL